MSDQAPVPFDSFDFSTSDKAEKEEPIHGTVSDLGMLTAIEYDGRLLAITHVEYRMDLQSAFLNRGLLRSVWDVSLQDGTRLTVCRDLTEGGWYEVPALSEP